MFCEQPSANERVFDIRESQINLDSRVNCTLTTAA